jgi:hypothetical protein
LAANENTSLVDSIKFGGEDAVKSIEAVEYLANAYKRTPCRSLEK